MKLKPLGDRVLVQPVEEEETTASGIVLPDTAKEKPQKGKVLAVGDGKYDEDGDKRIPLDVSEGDEVLYSKYGGTEITVDGEDLLVLRESDVLAKVETPVSEQGVLNGTQGTEVQRGGAPGARGAASTRSPNAVKVTLGPTGRYVVLDKKFGAPTITNDGVTIAREIEVEDVFENQGAQLVREVATATNDVAGDGTTTATVLAQSMVRQGMKNVAAGANPMALKRGVEAAVEQVVEHLRSKQSKDDLRQGADRPRRGHLGRRRGDRQRDRRRDRQGRQGRRRERRGGPDLRDGARVHRGHAVRQGLHLAVHGHRPGPHGGRASTTPTS